MSTRGEGVKLQGGTGPKCLDAVGILTNVNIAASKIAIVIMPCPDATEQRTCSDGEQYPYKAVVFHDAQARSVQCLSEAQAAALQASTSRTVRIDTVPSMLTKPISCPPPGTLHGEIMAQLGIITAWAASSEGAAILASAFTGALDARTSSKPGIVVATADLS